MSTDGPFQELKQWLAGFQIVDVESEERAIETAAKLSAVPGRGCQARSVTASLLMGIGRPRR